VGLPSLVVQKVTLRRNMSVIKAAILAIELAVTAMLMFWASHCFCEIVVVVILPFLLLEAFVLFDGFAFKDELGLCSKSGDVPIKVKLLPPSCREQPFEETHDLLVGELGCWGSKWEDRKAIVDIRDCHSSLTS
jgi:hypothetical protein